MRRLSAPLIAICFVLCWQTIGLSDDAAAYRPSQDHGPFEVEIKTLNWKDSKRDRQVPVKMYSL